MLRFSHTFTRKRKLLAAGLIVVGTLVFFVDAVDFLGLLGVLREWANEESRHVTCLPSMILARKGNY